MMHYWVYEDDPTNRVRVHKAICSRCNDGQGLKGSRHLDNRWHGHLNPKGRPLSAHSILAARMPEGAGFV